MIRLNKTGDKYHLISADSLVNLHYTDQNDEWRIEK